MIVIFSILINSLRIRYALIVKIKIRNLKLIENLMFICIHASQMHKNNVKMKETVNRKRLLRWLRHYEEELFLMMIMSWEGY